MGLASLVSDAVPGHTFTPAEHLVELLRICLDSQERLTLVLLRPHEKAFLVLMLIRAQTVHFRSQSQTATLLVFGGEQAELWRRFLARMTDLSVRTLDDRDDACAAGATADRSADVLVTTPRRLAQLWRQRPDEPRRNCLLILDNCHAYVQDPHMSSILKTLESTRSSRARPRFVSFTSHLLKQRRRNLRGALDQDLARIATFFSSRIEAGCEILTLLRFLARPKEKIVQHIPPTALPAEALELEIEASLKNFEQFLKEHQLSLLEIYGEGFEDLISEIPNPAEVPLQLIKEFRSILRTLGLWCAERASLIYLIKLDKLKTREKYERHFLLLGSLYTEMLRIRKLCEDTFGNLTEKEKILRFSKPKLLKLMNLLIEYKPSHIGDSSLSRRSRPKEESLEDSASSVVTEGEGASPTLAPADAVGGSERLAATKLGGGGAGARSRRAHFSSYDDPDSLCSIIFVREKFIAKIIYHFLKDLSRSDDLFSFLSPQYAITIDGDDSGVGNADGSGGSSEYRKQEEALRRFRMRECNVLVSNSLLEVGVDSVRCNLVVALDAPDSFQEYILLKVKAKAHRSWFLTVCESPLTEAYLERLAFFRVVERRLLAHCEFNDPTPPPTEKQKDGSAKMSDDHSEAEPAVATETFADKNAILYLNRYCAKLPSDTFTRLTPLWSSMRVPDREDGGSGDESAGGGFVCAIQLPINSPVKRLICGPVMRTLDLAKRAAAVQACKALHEAGELDEQMLPVGKEAVAKLDVQQHQQQEQLQQQQQEPQQELQALQQQQPKLQQASELKEPRPGTTKRRQFYYKKVAKCLSQCGHEQLDSDTRSAYFLYSIRLSLNCPIPDDQNTRGRKVHPPENARQQFGILVRARIPPICSFPIYTRSGEILVQIEPAAGDEAPLTLTQEQMELIQTCHRFTFSEVLRLEKYPMMFASTRSDNAMLIVPLVQGEIDWLFLENIKNSEGRQLTVVAEAAREDFVFSVDRFSDAVIMPWYRNQDQPQYFYVAEICFHLNPSSDFPGQGFETFERYYQTKYDISIKKLDQPLLDVDHTSARLNFLTPRYVNRKGIALPTSSEETKRNKRENLEQKQILVPELSTIHPFPASLWRQAVSLPCILYRLNGLLIADELRWRVAAEVHLGRLDLPPRFQWDALNFGWTLADVLKSREPAQQRQQSAGEQPAQKQTYEEKRTKKAGGSNKEKKMSISNESPEDGETKDELVTLNDELLNKLNEDEKKAKNKGYDIGTWSNEMAENLSSSSSNPDEGEFLSDLEDFELPDNLTFISTKSLPASSSGKKDWVSGIEQKPFRVGSPTFFDNPNINIPGMLDDDLDGYSTSDDSCVDDEEKPSNVANSDNHNEEEKTGSRRIEFRGGNTAETIEDETEEKKFIETLSRDMEEEAKMVEEIEWAEGEEEDTNALENDVKDEKEALENERNLCNAVDDNFSRQFPTWTPHDVDDVAGPNVEENFIQDEDIQRKLQEKLNLATVEGSADAVNESAETSSFTRNRTATEESSYAFSFDEQPDLSRHPGPSPSLILQACTMSNSNDAINLERLETIGDSFLKYAITTYLFCAHPGIHEGRLSHLRSKQVSNLNLFRLGKAKGLGECMIATKFEPHDNWLPPCYFVPRELEQALIESGVPESYWNMAELPGLQEMDGDEISRFVREKSSVIHSSTRKPSSDGGGGADDQVAIEDLPSFIPYNLLTQHSIPDKSIADCVEALIGAYLISCGPRGALVLMDWLGIRVLPPRGSDGPLGGGTRRDYEQLPQPPSPLLHVVGNPHKQLEHLLSGYATFCRIIGYEFRDRSYLLQAFSHASFFPNRLTDCYQRLEFLGDAVLDYLITRHLFEDERKHSPGALTDLRSALVNNTIFASLAVKFGFHKYFKHYSPGLQTVVDRFVKIQEESGYKVTEDYYFIEEADTEEAEDIEVPKALGDIFESVAGAIFLDSGFSLDTVWRVYHGMMAAEIAQFSSDVPKSPIRELLELEPETAKFSKPEKLADGRRVRVSVEVFGKGTFKGIGRNYRIAKCTAAKCALRALKKKSKGA